jgi:DNA-binding PucR family transcriptional regulator
MCIASSSILSMARNTTATASRLFIHRNTLLYRLRRIEEILGMDLAIADEQTLFMLYLSCLITNDVT